MSNFNVVFNEGNQFEVDFGVSIPQYDYDGPYLVTPTEEQQTLVTANKLCENNIVVDPIPSQYVVPTGTELITTLGLHNIADKEKVDVQIALKRGVIRPDAELVETWSYDKLWIEDEGNTLPPYSTTAITLKASEQLDVTHEWDLDNYKYLVLMRGLAIPFYNMNNIARGRVEFSISNAAFELVSTETGDFRAFVDPTIASRSPVLGWLTAGGAVYRMPYITNSLGQLSVYSATSYGIWVVMVGPTYGNGVSSINSPNLTLRCQANVFDKPFYEALTDIRFQWIIELWREPIGSLDYDGWTANQELEHILECAYSADHKLT